MNNRTMRFSLGAVAVGAMALMAQTGQGQSVVYNNTSSFTGDFNIGNGQTGNEIIQAGTFGTGGDEITSFAFQYDFLNNATGALGTPTGGETATLSFYNNYGLAGATKANGTTFTVPQTSLFASTPISLAANYTTGSTITYSIANGGLPANGVDVPQTFTWTVTFSGVGSAENAGLALYTTTATGQPTVGNNYGDAWYSANSGIAGPWSLDVASGSNPALTFGATVTAVPEPSTLGMFAMGSIGLLASGWRKLRR